MSKTVSASSILDLLKGEWFLNRKLINVKDQDFSGSASGTTKLLESSENTLSYDETVIVNFDNGAEINTTAAYKFQIEENKLHQYIVTQTNTEPKEDHMFELAFSATSSQRYAVAAYKCGNDNYSVQYSFSSDNRFSVIYMVSGPHKDYFTETEFKRILPEGENSKTEIGSEY